MSREAYELAATAARYAFVALMLWIVWRACRGAWIDSRRAARLRRLSPMTGLCGEMIVVEGDGQARRGMRYPVIREGTIGSSRRADIRIRDGSVRRRHAYFQLTESGLRVRGHAGARLRDGGGRPVRELTLGDGDGLCVGRVRLLLVLAMPDGVCAPPRAERAGWDDDGLFDVGRGFSAGSGSFGPDGFAAAEEGFAGTRESAREPGEERARREGGFVRGRAASAASRGPQRPSGGAETRPDRNAAGRPAPREAFHSREALYGARRAAADFEETFDRERRAVGPDEALYGRRGSAADFEETFDRERRAAGPDEALYGRRGSAADFEETFDRERRAPIRTRRSTARGERRPISRKPSTANGARLLPEKPSTTDGERPIPTKRSTARGARRLVRRNLRPRTAHVCFRRILRQPAARGRPRRGALRQAEFGGRFRGNLRPRTARVCFQRNL